jgi:hypothetical protein
MYEVTLSIDEYPDVKKDPFARRAAELVRRLGDERFGPQEIEEIIGTALFLITPKGRELLAREEHGE